MKINKKKTINALRIILGVLLLLPAAFYGLVWRQHTAMGNDIYYTFMNHGGWQCLLLFIASYLILWWMRPRR